MEIKKRGRPKSDNPKLCRFEMRISEQDLRKLLFLSRHHNDRSMADFLIKIIHAEYDNVMQELEEKAIETN